MSMFGKQALIALTGQVINVTGLTANELFTLNLASEVQKQPIWELLFCALFIYLFMEIAAAHTANTLAKAALRPALRRQGGRKTRGKQNGKLMRQNLIWTRLQLCYPFPAFSLRFITLEEPLAWISALIAERSRDSGGSVPRITGPQRPPEDWRGRSILFLQKRRALHPLRPLCNCVCFPQFKRLEGFLENHSRKNKKKKTPKLFLKVLIDVD